MKKRTQTHDPWTTYAVALSVGLVPLAALTWGLSKFFDTSFWTVLVWLLAVRLVFALIEFLGSVLSWHLVAKAANTRLLHSHLVENGMPSRYYQHDDLLAYLTRVQEDETASKEAKAAARELERIAAIWESRGIAHGMRFFSAGEAALERYSPRAAAPKFWDDLTGQAHG